MSAIIAIPNGAKIMWIGAHADDAVAVSGIFARLYTNSGSINYFVHIVDCFPEQYAYDEQLANYLYAARYYVYAERIVPPGADWSLYDPTNIFFKWLLADRDTVLRDIIISINPDIIVTFEPTNGANGHPEHRAVSYLVDYVTAGISISHGLYYFINRDPYLASLYNADLDPLPVTDTLNSDDYSSVYNKTYFNIMLDALTIWAPWAPNIQIILDNSDQLLHEENFRFVRGGGYEAAMTLSAAVSIESNKNIIGLSKVSLPAAAGITDQAPGIFTRGVTYPSNVYHQVASGFSYDKDVALSALSLLTESNNIDTSCAVPFSTSASVGDSSAGDLVNALIYQGIAGILNTGNLEIQTALTIATIAKVLAFTPAISTPEKRRLWMLPIPDGTITSIDRYQMAIGYSPSESTYIIDTPLKRRLWSLPIPDGTVDPKDKIHIAIGYSKAGNVYATNLTLSLITNFITSGFIDTQNAITLVAIAGIDVQTIVETIEAALILVAQASAMSASNIDTSVALPLDTIIQLVNEGKLDAGAIIALTSIADMVKTGTLALNLDLVLTTLATIAKTGTLDWESTLLFATQASTSSILQLDANALLALNAIAQIVKSSNQVANVTVTLQTIAKITPYRSLLGETLAYLLTLLVTDE